MKCLGKINVILFVIMLFTETLKFMNNGFAEQCLAGVGVIDFANRPVNIKIDYVYQIAINNGIKQWILNARSVLIEKTNIEMIVNGLKVEFFLNDGEIVFLSADFGIIRLKSKYLKIYGNVICRSFDFLLRTELVDYDPKFCKLNSNSSATLHGCLFSFRADSVVVGVDTKFVVLSGNVQGVFDDTSMA